MHRRNCILAGLIFGFLIAFSGRGFSEVRAQDLNPVAVKRSLEDGIAYLREKQQNDGGWPEYGNGENCGISALTVLALVSAGVEKDDQMIQRAMNYLRGYGPHNVQRTYSMSLLTMAFCLVDPEQDALKIRSCVQWLEDSQKKGNQGKQHIGGWRYTAETPVSDNSVAQFAILALYEAERVGISVDPDVWKRAMEYWINCQNRDGSWGYEPQPGGGSGNGTGSMSTAGIASLIITSGMVDRGGAQVRGEQILCCQDFDDSTQERIRRGLAWMGKEFNADQNPKTGEMYYYYYMYGLERIGRLTASRFIGTHDWYRAGTEKLLIRKGNEGKNWSGGGFSEIVATDFALLFISKGRRPILVSKIEYGNDAKWNAHPSDINHLVAYVEKEWKQDLTWQVIDISKASPEDLAQTPVIYLCGDKSPIPPERAQADRLVEKLRGYLDQGGFIFAEAYADENGFDRGFRELIRRVLPEEGYELRLLEESHPIWQMDRAIAPDQVRRIEGIDFGCRTSVVYAPAFTYGSQPNRPPSVNSFKPSLSCLWELANPVTRGVKHPPKVQHQIDNGLILGSNILAYATNRELTPKEEQTVAPLVTQRSDPSDRGKIRVGLLNHGGGSNCAPRAIPKLLNLAASELGIRINSRVDQVPASEDGLAMYPILFMHGRTAFRFNEEERKALRDYIERGGFLFVNSVCASSAFTESFRREMKLIFAEADLEEIELGDPLLSEAYGGRKVDRLKIRIPQKTAKNKMEASIREIPPKLEGIRIDQRWAVVFSPYDVSCALEKSNAIECEGYTPESAMTIGLNVILYAIEHL